MESYKNPSEKNQLEHLNPGVSPIMACVGTREDFEEEPTPGLTDRLHYFGENPQTLLVDYYATDSENNMKGIKHAGEKTYAISEISGLNKFSLKYANCTGVIVAGQDKVNGKNISFFTHQDSMKILPEGEVRKHFIADLKSRLEELQNRTVPGTVDAVIFGGSFLDNSTWTEEDTKIVGEKVDFEKEYTDSINLLSAQISDVLGFEPTVIAGPKTMHGRDDAIYDNEHRRLYLRRPKIGDNPSENFNSSGSFSPQKMSEREEVWRKEWK